MYETIAAATIIPVLVFSVATAGIALLVNRLPQALENARASRAVSRARISKIIQHLNSNLRKYLSLIKGNEVAKNIIIEMILGWVESKQTVSTSSRTGGLVLYLIGPSGIGKTMAAEAVARALLGEKATPIVISLSSIDPASSDSTDAQLFGKKIDPAYGNLKVVKYSPLVSQLRLNPKTVVIINEYDKLVKRDGTLDARLWDIADNGFIVVGGEKIDCSETVFIVTSNERPSCIGVEHRGQVDKNATEVEHNSSFMSRVNVVVFEDPGDNIYLDVFQSKFASVSDDYKKRYNIVVNINKQSLEILAADVHKINRGIRSANRFVHKLYSALTQYRLNNDITTALSSEMSVEVDYDASTQSFTVH